MRFLEWVIANAAAMTGGSRLEGPDLIILSIFCRSTRTYEAVVRHLGEKGFGEQGLMLNRSLFEDMVDAHWVTLNEDLAVTRLAQHDLYSRLLRADTQRKFPDMFDGRPPPKIKVSNDERKELKRLFGRRGSGSWTGPKELDDMLTCWKTEEDRLTVQFWEAWVLKMSNETLHPSAFSIGRMGAPTVSDDGEWEWRFGATKEWLTQALHGAWWVYQQTVGLIVERYAPSYADAFAEQVMTLNREFRDAHHWETTGRLEPAPQEASDAPSPAQEVTQDEERRIHQRSP